MSDTEASFGTLKGCLAKGINRNSFTLNTVLMNAYPT